MESQRTFGQVAYAETTTDELIGLAEDAEARFGAADPWTLHSRDKVASRFTQEKYAERAIHYEEETLRRRLSTKKSENAREDEETSENRMRLAYLYSETENPDAINQFRAALRSLEAHQPLRWAKIVEARNGLACELWINEDQPELVYEVIEISMKTLDQAVSILGADHQAMINCRYNLAKALASTENFEEACGYFKENIGILESMEAGARALRELDETLIEMRGGLEECYIGMLGSCASENAKAHDIGSGHEKQPNEPDRSPHMDLIESMVQPHVIADQFGSREDQTEERAYEANGGSESQRVDTLESQFEDGGAVLLVGDPCIKSRPEGKETPNQGHDEEMGCESEPNGSTHSENGSYGTSSTKRNTSDGTRVDSPLSDGSPSFFDINERQGAGNTNETDISRMPGERPSDMATVNPSGKHRQAHSTSNLPSQVSENGWSNATQTQPNRPASVAEVKRTETNWSGPSDYMSKGADILRSHGIDPHPSDEFFHRLEDNTLELLDKDCGEIEGFCPKPVRIAVLDTGVQMPPSHEEKARAQIKLGKSLHPSLPPDRDEHGHGTHCAGILMKICPYATIYVYRVSKGLGEALNPEIVAAGIHHAVSVRKVDVISMSFGWKEDTSSELRKAIEFAKQQKVLMFAAASNEGRDISFPARADEVFAVDAASHMGRDLPFNPRATGHGLRLTALGEEVLSAWPISPDSGHISGYKRQIGTSAATPVAAATAALILTFARQPPLCFDTDVEGHLKDMRGMRRILVEAVGKKKEVRSDFVHVDITELLRVDSNYPDGGEWHDWLSLRMDIAKTIVTCLCSEFAPNLKAEWGRKLTDFLREHPPQV